MKPNQKELRQLYASGALAFTLLATGSGLVWWSYRETQAAQQAQRLADQRLGDFAQRLRQVSVEEQEIRSKAAYFRALEQRRIVGPEQRLDWIELIDAIREQRQLFEIDYEISEQKADGAPFGDYRLNASEMQFHLPLLHEGDLIGFIADLRQRAPALVQVRRCEITRLPGSERHPGDPNLDARCHLQWSTIGPVEKRGGPP